MALLSLNEICSELHSGKSISAADIAEDGPYPVIGGNGRRGYTREYNFDGDCAVIGRQGAACGNARFFSGKGYMTEHAVIAKPAPLHDARYLAYLLGTQQLGRLSGQSAQPGLSIKVLGAQLFDMPSHELQQRVSTILGALDGKIALNSRINDHLEKLLSIEFAKLLKNKAQERLLVDAIDILSGGTPKTSNPDYWRDGSIPLFSPRDVGKSPYVVTTEKSITNAGLDNCNSALYPTNTVLLTARGTVGKVAIAGRPMAMNQSCFALVGRAIPQSVVYQAIKKAVAALKLKANGATFAAINTRDLGSEALILPTLEDMKRYDSFAKPIWAYILANTYECSRLGEARDTLLPKLMSGEIDVSRIDLKQLNGHLSADSNVF